MIYIARNVIHRHARDEEKIYVHVYLQFAGLICHYSLRYTSKWF